MQRRPCLILPLVFTLGLPAGCGRQLAEPGARSSAGQPSALQPGELRGMGSSSTVSGTFAPTGPPLAPPVRGDAGGHCIVDIRQGYAVSGSLSGSFQIDYRIIIYGPCPVGPPIPGTLAEDWIAHGTFTGTMDGAPASASFSYIAHVETGGDVQGRIVLADGLTDELSVRGNFADGELSYEGQVR